MSDLQLGLIVIGILIVIAVYAFNRFQELQLRRKVERRFAQPEDVLMRESAPEASALAQERIEPSMTAPEPAPEPPEAAVAEAPEEPAVVVPDDATEPMAEEVSAEVLASEAAPPPGAAVETGIDYICSVESSEPFGHANLEAFLKSANAIGKAMLVQGWNPHAGEWQALPSAGDERIARLQVMMQLADRAGAVNRVQLSSVRDLCYALAERVGGSCRCGDIDQAAHQAAEIDRFCAQVDVSLGCNVVPRSGGLTGTKLRGMLESAGFHLDSSGRFLLRNDEGTVILVAEDVSGEPFSVERLRSTPVDGVMLGMDVPRVPNGVRVFERMIELARHLAHALDGVVVDDNRAELTDTGLKVIRQHLKSVHTAMEANGIPAGSPLAVRLFS
jgi:hypothetical protein